MIKKILVSFCLLLSFLSFAQEGSYSPYSFYGIGDQRFKGTIDTRAMGGVSIFPDSIHLNIQNPASFSSLKMTTFSVGATGSWAKLHTETQEEKAKRVTLDYLAVGLPLKKAGIAFGLMPYSSVGYKIRNNEVIGEGDTIRHSFNGSGGINRVFLGAGYEVTKNFRVGADVNFNFGKVETSSLAQRTDVQFASREINQSDLSGFSVDLGVMYEGKVNKKLHAFGAISFTPSTNLTTTNYRNIATVQLLQLGGVLVVDQDTIFYNQKRTLKLPTRLSLGAGIGEPRKWQAGAEITFQGSKDQKNRFNDINNGRFENAIKYSIGGYYIPNYNSFSNYWSRIVLRAGARYENTGLILNNKSIYDAAGTLGFGFPITGSLSNINVALEYGKRGTKAYGLVAENYFNLGIGFSFNDKWFVKRRYD
ncbi:hypothetical protein HUK80_16515 [Flavobacterium sp. MAH-1]|uniref:Long-chain fatty acid transport protein n=1 Tax=Flavobacterium agri TaxID=2743471 RepID=A0A7Y8Y4M0_9FLAO|nr:hypothetical protein [Flavobacterium agri]NUY82510.1 hypothetical protein [Flavobacterium agri]NYA72534.1 hypothetical protein [Flavobacterium agri]